VRGTLEELRGRVDELSGAILAIDVLTEGPAPGIADEVREILPDALYVKAEYPREETSLIDREGMTLSDLYEAYVLGQYGAPASDELKKAFRELCDDVGVSI
jgi:hypothetical protein